MAATAAEKLRDKLKKLFAMLGSNNAAEREAARCKIDELLVKSKKNWNDLTELLSTGNAQGWQDDEYAEDIGDGVHEYPVRPPPLDLIRHILQRHLHLTWHQFVAVTLWVAHTFLYDRFAISPRLALESPVRGCGKSTLLNIINILAIRTIKSDHITAAVLFRLIDRDRPTLLLDEADNQDLPNDPTLRAVINSGHHCDGKIMRYLDGRIQSFSTFAPLAFATFIIPVIVTLLPLISFAPRIYRWLYVRRIDQLHRILGNLERDLSQSVSTPGLSEYQKRIAEIELDVHELRVARAFEVDLQRLKAHLRMVQEDVRRMGAVS